MSGPKKYIIIALIKAKSTKAEIFLNVDVSSKKPFLYLALRLSETTGMSSAMIFSVILFLVEETTSAISLICLLVSFILLNIFLYSFSRLSRVFIYF